MDIAVGGTTILQGVPTDAAAVTAGAICASVPEDVHTLAQQVDADGTDQTVCAGLPGGELTLTQNVSASASEPEDGGMTTPEDAG